MVGMTEMWIVILEREQLQERVEQLEKENQQLLDDNYSVNEQSHAKVRHAQGTHWLAAVHVSLNWHQ